MSKKLIACLAVFAALLVGTAWAAWPAAKTAGCCYPGSECCFPGSPCCGDDCCYKGSPCCDPPQACCFTVSAEAKEAAPAADVTVIAVEDMDCPSCAKKIVARLNEVAGVAKVVADTKASKVSVTPKEKAAPSAKAMWEAVEKAGFKPTRLEGPSGKFTASPKE